MNPTPNRQRIRNFLTPRIEDFLVTETEDLSRKDLPEYATPHPDTERYPDHVFSYALPADDQGLLYTAIYAKKRERQDDYNWEFTDADIGGTKFPAVKRTYVTLRSEFVAATPTMGTSMPDKPLSMFGTGAGDPLVISDYVLAERDQKRSGDKELDAVFVVDVHVYVKRFSISDINTDKTLGIGVQRKTTLYYRGETPSGGGTTIEALFAAPTNAFWGTQSNGVERDGQQISANWFAVIETSSRDDALLAYKLALPTVTNLNLPDVLEGVEVVWNKATSTGAFNSDWQGLSAWSPADDVSASLSGAESASAEASASIQPEVILNIRQPLGRNIPSTSYFFYMKLTSSDSISSGEFRSRLGTVSGVSAQFWPSFNPVAHTIFLKGQKVAVSAKASASGSVSARGDAATGEGSISWDKNYGTGDSYDVSTMNGVVRIPPTLHDTINISGTLTDTAVATAACDVGWVTYTTSEMIAGETVAMPAVTADSGTKTSTATGLVYPSTLAATDPIKIPDTGYFITESSIKPYEAGWVQCFAEVINAADI